MDKVISEIADEEKVARILFSPSHVYKGQVSPKAFKLEKLKSGAEDYISVLRYNADQLDSVSAVFQPRTKGDSRYGYTFLNARDVEIWIMNLVIGRWSYCQSQASDCHCMLGSFYQLMGGYRLPMIFLQILIFSKKNLLCFVMGCISFNSTTCMCGLS